MYLTQGWFSFLFFLIFLNWEFYGWLHPPYVCSTSLYPQFLSQTQSDCSVFQALAVTPRGDRGYRLCLEMPEEMIKVWGREGGGLTLFSDRLAASSGHLHLELSSFQKLRLGASEPLISHCSLLVPPQPQSGRKSCRLPLPEDPESACQHHSGPDHHCLHWVLVDASSRSPNSSLAPYRLCLTGPQGWVIWLHS